MSEDRVRTLIASGLTKNMGPGDPPKVGVPIPPGPFIPSLSPPVESVRGFDNLQRI
jgi:hypothetical protein